MDVLIGLQDSIPVIDPIFILFEGKQPKWLPFVLLVFENVVHGHNTISTIGLPWESTVVRKPVVVFSTLVYAYILTITPGPDFSRPDIGIVRNQQVRLLGELIINFTFLQF